MRSFVIEGIIINFSPASLKGANFPLVLSHLFSNAVLYLHLVSDSASISKYLAAILGATSQKLRVSNLLKYLKEGKHLRLQARGRSVRVVFRENRKGRKRIPPELFSRWTRELGCQKGASKRPGSRGAGSYPPPPGTTSSTDSGTARGRWPPPCCRPRSRT